MQKSQIFSIQFVPFRGLKGRKKGMLVNYENKKFKITKKGVSLILAGAITLSTMTGCGMDMFL